MQVSPSSCAADWLHTLHMRIVRAGEVRRSAEQFGQGRDQALQGNLRCLARGNAFRFRIDLLDQCLGARRPMCWQLIREAPFELGGELGVGSLVGGEAGVPISFEERAELARVPAIVGRLWNLEWRIGPSQRRARRADLLLAKRSTVNGLGSRLVGRAFTDDRLAADQGGSVGDPARLSD